MRHSLIPIAFALTQAIANVSFAQTSQLNPADIFNLEMASDPQISPNGQDIVYTRRSNDIMSDRTRSSIWILDYNGNSHRPLVSVGADYSNPRWSGDSKRIVYLQSKDGKMSLNMAWVENGESARLAELPFPAGGLTWSPDGNWLAFTMFTPAPAPKVDIKLPAKPPGAEWAAPALIDETTRYEFDGVGEIPDGNSQIYIMSSQGGTPRALTSFTSGSLSGLHWSPDSKRVLFSLGSTQENGFSFRQSDIYAVEISDGTLEKITDSPGYEMSPQISPDGEKLAYIGESDRADSHINNDLYVMDLKTGKTRQLLKDLDRGIAQIHWANNRSLFVRFDDQGKTYLALANLNDGLTRLTDQIGGTTFGRPYTSGQFSASKTGRWAATLARSDDLANVGVGTTKGQARMLTNLNVDSLGLRDMARVESIHWKSSADGRDIQGWVAYPPNFDPQTRYPLILEIHGGPHTAYGPQFSGEVQLMAAAGYVVLYSNPRGSTSYGEAFANLIDKNYPGEDVDDLLSGIDALIERGFIDENRLFVTGGSGGGVLTAQLIGVTNRFAAAAVGKPVINWASFTLAADIGPIIYPYWFGDLPWESPEEYWRRSPLSLVGNVKTPSLVFVGGEDRRTPVFEAEQYYNALQIQGIKSRFVRIPGAYHGIADSRPTRLLQKVGHILAWFEEHDPKYATTSGNEN